MIWLKKQRDLFLFSYIQLSNFPLGSIPLWFFSLSLFVASLIVLEMAEALPDVISLHFPWKWRTPILPDKILDFCWLDQFWCCVAFDIITGTRGVGMHWLAYPSPSFNQSLDRRIMLSYLVQTHGGGWWSRG